MRGPKKKPFSCKKKKDRCDWSDTMAGGGKGLLVHRASSECALLGGRTGGGGAICKQSGGSCPRAKGVRSGQTESAWLPIRK